MQESAEIAYLKHPEVGKVLARALAELYSARPLKPVKYLAEWLLNYSRMAANHQAALRQEQARRTVHESLEKERVIAKAAKAEHTKRATEQQEVIDNFVKRLQTHEYLEELLREEFPQFIEKQTGMTGVYVGHFNHSEVEVEEMDEHEQAHLNLAGPKLVNYVGASRSHQFMLGRVLPLGQGLTVEVLSLSPEGEESRPVYVPDVIKNEKMYFHRLPKLGAYLAIPMVCESYLTLASFDHGVAQKKKYLHEKTQFEKERQTALEGLAAEIEQLTKKSEPLTEEEELALKELQHKEAEQRQTQCELQEPNYESVDVQYVLCMDTMGQNREIPQSDRALVVDYVRQFKAYFASTEKRILEENIDLQLRYEFGFKAGVAEYFAGLEAEVEQAAEEKGNEVKDASLGQRELDFEKDVIRLRVMHRQLEREDIQGFFLGLKKYRLLKFPGVMQHLLYFLGHSKAEVNLKNRTQLNWKHVRELLDQKLIRRLLEYDFHGSKPALVKPYAKVNYLLERLQAYKLEELTNFNVGYALVLSYLLLLLRVRKVDVAMRQERIQQLKLERKEAEEENDRVREERVQAMEQAKVEQGENFVEEEWGRTYDEEHPEKPLPEEVKEDVDNDIE